MTPLRRAAILVGLPLVVLLEACAWWGGRSLLFLLFSSDWGIELSSGRYEQYTRWLDLLTLGGLLLGGLLGAAAGPLPTLVLGVLATAAGLALLPFAGPDLVLVGLGVLAFGQGLVRPSVWSAVVRPFGFPAEHLRTLAVLLAYGAYNLAGMLSSPVVDLVRDGFGQRAAFLGSAALALVATLVAAGVLAAWFLGRGEAVEAPPRIRGALPVALGLLLLTAPPLLAWNQTWSLTFAAFEAAGTPLGHGFFFALNPFVVFVVALVLVFVLLGLHIFRVRLPAMAILGLGLVILALGALLLVQPFVEGNVAVALVAVVVLAVGETLAVPFLWSRMLGDLHPRLAPLVAATWLILNGGSTTLLRWLEDALGWTWIPMAAGWTMVGSGLLFGLVLIAAAWPLQRRLLEPA